MTESTNNLLPMRFDNKEINKKNPWSDDALERKKFADILTDRVENGISPYTISINGGWGTGKTFLLQRWRQQLKQDNYKAIYYNAWEDDFCVNPLVSIIGQIATEIKGDGLDGLIGDVKETATSLLAKKILGYAHLTKEELQNRIDNTIDEYSEQTAQIEKLKERLEKLTTAIKSKNKNKPLIFIVDELDRCRPTFAIEVLERIKHLFNIPNLIFVLGMNKTELKKSIKHVYGDIVADEYLRRFYDIDLTLSAPKSFDYWRHLINTNKNALVIIASGKNRDSYIQSSGDIYPYIVHYLDLSLRDTEHCFRMLCFMLNTKSISDNGEGWSAIYLIVLRIKDPELYWSFVQGISSCKNVVNYICKFIPDIDNNTTTVVHDIVKGIYALANDIEWENTTRTADNYRENRLIDSPEFDKRVLPLIKSQGAAYFNIRYGDQALRNMASLLDLVER